jgi:hypothetical protein
MPETVAPAPPAPSAPAAPAPSAPAPSSAPSPAAPPAAPATPVPAALAAPAPPAAPAAPAPGAKYDPKTSLTPPKSSEFPNTAEGLIEFTRANSEWSTTHPDEAEAIRSAKIAAEDGVQPAEVKPTDAVAAEVAKAEGEPEAPKPAAEPVTAATPAVIEEWTGKSPELKAAFEKSPELRTAIMEMARQNEAARPVLDIVGTPEEAQFAVDHAGRLVSLQANWMLSAEDPEMATTAWDQTVDMFKERDQNGAEVKGLDGRPKLGSDFKPFIRKAASSALEDFVSSDEASVNTLKARLAGNYATEDAREADTAALEQAEYNLAADRYLLERLKAGAGETRQLPQLPANATEEQKAFQRRLQEESAELDAKTGKATTTDRKAAGKAVDREVQAHYEAGLNSYIDTQIAAMKERGEYLPDFVLNDKWVNPTTGKVTGLTAFGVKLYQALNAKVNGNPLHTAKLAQLQALGAAGKDARKAEVDRLRNLYLPKLFDAEVKRIQDGIRASVKKPAAAAPSIARTEPQSQATVVPSGMSQTEVRTWAEGEAKKDPNYSAMSTADREALTISLAMKKRYGG